MKVTLNYAEFVNVLGFSNTVLSDKSVEDKLKNVIFIVKDDSVKVIGHNATTFCRTELQVATTEDIPEKGWDFQIKAASLNKIIQSFSSLFKTKVEKMEIADDGVKIKISVFEEPLEEKDAALAQRSDFYVETAPILSNILKDVNTEFPEDGDLLDSPELFLYLESLLPLMSNDPTSNSSKMNFAEDYVFIMSPRMSTFFKNKLPDAFKGLALSHSSVTFLKKMTEGSENIRVCRTDKYLCLQNENTEAFLRYQNIKIKYKMYLDKFSNEIGIEVDRLYLKDVLKRMNNLSPESKVYIAEDGSDMEVVSSDFRQNIPLNKVKDEAKGISFSVSSGALEKAIVGREDVFTDDVRIYFTPTARGYMIYLKDKTGTWLSNMQVTKA